MGKTISPGLKASFLAGCFTAGIFGLLYMLVPEAYQKLIGVPIKQPTEATAFRDLGVALIALAYAVWLSSRETSTDKVKIVVKMVIVWMVLGAFVMLWCMFSYDLPVIYWLYFAIFAGFAIAFSVFYPRE
jgi:uncharacterized protein YjeT (DUF2065 family)